MKQKMTRKQRVAQEKRDAAIDVSLKKLYDELSASINDPFMLAVTMAKVYAKATLTTYKQYKEQSLQPSKN